MSVPGGDDGVAGSRGNVDVEPHDLFSEALEMYIEQLESFASRADTERWEQAVIQLRDAARGVKADRITTTATLLLSVEISDGRMIRHLLDRLRSEGRIFALEEVCRRREEALALELSALRIRSERDQA